MGDIVYTSQNSLFKVSAGRVSEFPPQRIEKYRETLREINSRKEWKTTGTGAQFMGAHRPKIDGDAVDIGARVHGAARYEDGLIYSVSIGQVGGLYKKKMDSKETLEGHIFAQNALDVLLIDVFEGTCAAGLRTGSGCHIALFDVESGYYREITEGDVIENYPGFSRDGRRIYFASSGFLRAEDGRVIGIGPYAVCAYGMEDQSVEELFSSDEDNYIAPKEGVDGELYFMRRPYRTKVSNENLFIDVLMLPIRIVKGILGFINYFTMSYGGEAIHRQGGNTKAKQMNDRQLFIDGNIVNAMEEFRKNTRAGEQFPGIVPQSWMLMRSAAGKVECVKKGVMSYELCKNGDILYSNGHAIVRLAPDGREELICKAHLATNIVHL